MVTISLKDFFGDIHWSVFASLTLCRYICGEWKVGLQVFCQVNISYVHWETQGLDVLITIFVEWDVKHDPISDSPWE